MDIVKYVSPPLSYHPVCAQYPLLLNAVFLSATLCPATQRQKLVSTPCIGTVKAYLPPEDHKFTADTGTLDISLHQLTKYGVIQLRRTQKPISWQQLQTNSRAVFAQKVQSNLVSYLVTSECRISEAESPSKCTGYKLLLDGLQHRIITGTVHSTLSLMGRNWEAYLWCFILALLSIVCLIAIPTAMICHSAMECNSASAKITHDDIA